MKVSELRETLRNLYTNPEFECRVDDGSFFTNVSYETVEGSPSLSMVTINAQSIEPPLYDEEPADESQALTVGELLDCLMEVPQTFPVCIWFDTGEREAIKAIKARDMFEIVMFTVGHDGDLT